MPRFRVPTDEGTFEVETDVTDPTEEELLALVDQSLASALSEPGLLRRAAALGTRVGGPLVGGLAGFAVGGPLGAAGGAAAGGAAGELAAETILGEELSPSEIALSAALSAIPAGPAARAAAKPGITIARRALLTTAEGAAQGALAAEAESIVREGELAGIPQVVAGAAGGAVLGGALGLATGKAARAALTPEVPLAPQTAAAEAVEEAQGNLFRQVPGLGGEVPPASPIPDSRLTELQESVDRLFPHLGEVERMALKRGIAHDGDRILEHSRSVQSVERTDALAQELVFDLSRPLPKGTALNAEQMRHVVNLVSPLQERVTQLAGEVAARPDDEVLKLKLQQATNRLTNVIFSYSGARAEAGRTLNILQHQAKALAVGDAKAIMSARKLGVDAETIAKIIAATPNDPVSQYRQLRDMARPGWRDALRWYYYSNILSGPRTHARNLLSNTISLALRPLTTPFSAATDVAAAAVGRREREVFLGEAPIQVLQAYRALPEAFNKMAFMFRNGFSLSDVQDFEVRPPEMLGGVATNIVGRSMAAVDEFYRAIGFSMEMHSGAFSRARRQALREGTKGAALTERTSELMSELLDQKPRDLLEQAERYSRRITFQEEDNAVARGLIAARDTLGVTGSILLPFVRTPANIFRQGLQFSPAGLLVRAPAGREGQQRIGEAALGSALLLPVAWLAATGNITGAPPTDAGERDAFYAEGKRPNSIRVGDTWVGYNELGPLALPFSVVANAADAARRGGGELSAETIGTIVGQVGRSTLDASYLASLSAVFQAIEDPQRYGRAFLENLAAGFIPAVGLQRNIRDVLDPTVRQATTFAEGLERNIPVLSERLQPKLDALGQPVTKPTGPTALAVPSLSPARTDPIRAELSRLGVTPDPLKRETSVTLGDEKIPLDPDVDFARRRAAGAFRVLFLRELFADPEYQAASDEGRKAAVEQDLRRATELANNGVKDLLAAEQPVTFEALTEGMADAPEIQEQSAPAAPQAPAPAASTVALGGPPTALDPLFEAAAADTGVDPTFLKAVARVESNFNPNARGPATKWGTAIGPMQILPSTFRLFERAAREILGREPSITDPADNVLVGALYYRSLLDQVDNDPAAAARLYHGGPNLQLHGPKTRAYGEKIAATYASYTGGE